MTYQDDEDDDAEYAAADDDDVDDVKPSPRVRGHMSLCHYTPPVSP